MNKNYSAVFSFFLAIALVMPYAWAQTVPPVNCTSATPSYIVDLSSSPTATYLSPPDQRAGDCCGTDNNCIEFQITLHPNAVGIQFGIASGAQPSGSLNFQINCGPLTPIGTPICLTGAGPHILTFCKPGNNQNTYTVTSYSAPQFGPDIIQNEGCGEILYANFYDESSITWQSVSPGTPGLYNSALSCITGCDTTNFNGVSGMPSPITYKVCGNDQLGCFPDTVCGLINASFVEGPSIAFTQDTALVCSPTDSIYLGPQFSNTEPYSMTWSNGKTGDSVFLQPGWTNITVNDTAGCKTIEDSIFVGLFNNLATADAGPDQTICGGANATLSGITTNAASALWTTSGTGTFSPNNSINSTYSPSLADQNSGSVWLYLAATNSNGCPDDIDSLLLTISDWTGATILTVTDVSCFGLSDGSASVTISGGSNAPYTYNWNNSGTTNSNSITGLSAGTQTLTIENSLGCDTTVTFTIAQPPVLAANNLFSNDASCNGGTDGSIAIGISGGTSPYNIIWTGGYPNNDTLTNLPAGTYQANITDANNCPISINATVGQPAPLANSFNTPIILCHGQSSTIVSTPSGGTPGYTYQWNGSQGTSNYTTQAGTHQLIITDANGCTLNDSYVLNEPDTLIISLPADTEVCAGYNQNIVSNVTGGTTPYSYSWSHDNTQTTGTASATINNNTAITVTVTDQNGCVGSDDIQYSVLIPPTVAISHDTTFLCPGVTSTWVYASISNPASTNFTMNWSNGSTVDSAQFSFGTHYVNVTDYLNCNTSTDSIFITQQTVITDVDAGPDMVFCHPPSIAINGTVANGQNTLWTTAGTGFFSNTTTTSTNYFPSNSDLSSGGIYLYLSAQSLNNCPGDLDSLFLTFSNWDASTASSFTNISCFGANDGSISVTTSGGSYGPYNYSFNNSPFGTQNSWNNLSAGSYSVTINNSVGCDTTINFTIAEPAALNVTALFANDVSCNGGSDGSLAIDITGGTAPYTINWLGGFPSNDTLSNLTAATYSANISDANGCTNSISVPINEPTSLTNSFNSPNILCYGQTATIVSTVSGGTPGYSYQWNNVAGNSNFTAPAGTHTLTVVDANGCTLTDQITLNEPDSLILNLPLDQEVCAGSTQNIAAITSGGNQPYTYSWSHDVGQTGSNASAVISTNTTINTVVTDQNGCTASDQINFSILVPPSVSINDDTLFLCPGVTNTWVYATITNPGNTNHSISWSNGSSVDSAQVGFGTHFVNVTDYLGCNVATDSIVITQQTTLTNVDAGMNQVICNNSNVVLGGNVVNGTNPLWSGGNGLFSNITQPNTNYQPTQTEINNGTLRLYLSANSLNNCPGDIDSVDLTFAQITSQITGVVDHITCHGFANGAITVNVNNPQYGPMTYSLNGQIPSNNNYFSGLGPGMHQVTIANSLGCDTTVIFFVNEPAVLTASISNLQDITCFGSQDGYISLQISGGTLPYTYNWGSNLPNTPTITNLGPGTYNCSVTDANGCNTFVSATINEPQPLANSFNYNPIQCYGGSAIISSVATGGSQPYTYTWNGQPGTNAFNGTSGTYSLQITDANGCILASNITLTEPPQLQASIPTGLNVCNGTSVTIQSNYSGGTPGYSFAWSHDPTNTLDFTTLVVTEDTIVSLSITDDNNCAVVINSAISVYQTNSSDFNLIGSPLEICAGDTSILDYLYTSNTPIDQLTWIGCSNCTFPNSVAPTQDTTYFARLITVCQDTLLDSIQIEVHEAPIWDISPDDITACPNEPISFQLNNGNVPQDWLYSWQFGDEFTSSLANPSIAFPDPGFYSVNVTVITAFGCTFSSNNTATVQIHPKPDASFTVDNQVKIILNAEFNFFNSSTDADTYSWTFGDGDTSSAIHPSHIYNAPGNYMVNLFAQNVYGCVDSAFLAIIVEPEMEIYVPNAFSPDGDGDNEFFHPVSYQLNPKDYRFRVYDRWGHVVFETSDTEAAWDGTLMQNGKNATPGAYAWVVLYRDLKNKNQRKSGHVTLIR